MPMILVTPLSLMPEALRDYRPSHLVTLLSPGSMIDTPAGFPAARHLRLGLNDISDPSLGEAPPGARHIAELIAFGRTWDAKAPLLVHCWAGVSRSMAAAYTVLCDRAGPEHEKQIAQAIRARASYAQPNRLLVRYADEALGREGRMIAAVEALGPGAPVEEGVATAFPLDLAGP
jgi:predicted protein tyrosine phosphatase